MGTSSSYPGPTGNPLLPPWADPLLPDDANNGDGDGDNGDGGPDGETPDDHDDGDQPPHDDRNPPRDEEQRREDDRGPVNGSPTKPVPKPPKPVTWRAPKRALTDWIKGKGSARAVGRAYVRACGGPRQATARAASSGAVASTARVGGFISSVARNGFAEAARQIGLNWVGRPAQFVLASLIDLLSPDGALIGEAAARKANAETLAALFERCDVETNSVAALDSLSAADVQELTLLSVSNCINEQMQVDLVNGIERGGLTEDRANALMDEMRDFIEGIVRFDFRDVDLLSLDWGGPGRRMVERIYQTAYSLMEETP